MNKLSGITLIFKDGNYQTKNILNKLGKTEMSVRKINKECWKGCLYALIALPLSMITLADSINPSTTLSSNLNSSQQETKSLKRFKLTLLNIAKERNPEFKLPQHFYLSNYNEDTEASYLYWAEMKLLWIIPIDQTERVDNDPWLDIRYPSNGQLIDMKNDVVESNKEVGSSTYLVSKEWAEKRLFESVIEGDLILINNANYVK